MSSPDEIRQRAYVRIVEEPASKAVRFRYQCEGRSAGSIPGASSTSENKTFPSIQIVGYIGRAIVVVSCVTEDEPYRPHPHNLVGKKGCKKGVCTMEIPPKTMSVTFSNFGIQCVKRKDIESSLRMREEVRVDPFKTGFEHRSQPSSIDLNAVRLCFQVFLESESGKYTVPLAPVVSQPIYDKKSTSELAIVELSECVSYVDGGKKIMIFCEKVAKEDIQIRFFETKDGQIVWEALVDFQPSQVHKQTAISFRTPRYRTLEITEPVMVFIQLRRPSDGMESEALPFQLLPLDSVPGTLKRKRQKYDDPLEMLTVLQEQKATANTIPCPFCGQMYAPNSPTYDPNLSPMNASNSLMNASNSPTYAPNLNLTYAPNLPVPSEYQQADVHCNHQYNPPIEQTMQHWNIPTASADPAPMMTDDSSTPLLDNNSCLGSLLDMNSGELATLILSNANNLSESFGMNMSLLENCDGNERDSFTRLVNPIGNLCQIDDVC